MSKKIKFVGIVIVIFLVGWGGYVLGVQQLNKGDEVCVQKDTQARNLETGETRRFSTPCDIPDGWEEIGAEVLSSGAVKEGYAIYVQNQPAGEGVFISRFSLDKYGWIAIHEDRNGVPENILGAARFSPDVHQGEVGLLRGTEDEGVYYAMIHADNGDKVFDLKNDTPVVHKDGEVIMARFIADDDAPDPRK